ncbi:MAG: UDP-N-acetylmuramoyl-tripeptide--D-alanyl-D-alanine ligase [Desulfobacterales bacterium]|nr:UDP-N-acetylmuramoyl-tripeptide--D-alanyl-D-alanine ligase [Desulfobacterales bacterium]
MTSNSKTWGVSDVLHATGGRLVCGSEETRFQAISTDSRTAEHGDLFIAIAGEKCDGHDFLQEAFDRGALGVLVAEDYISKRSQAPKGEKHWIAVPDTLKALGDLAAFGRRQSNVSVVAVTGTNGKTTTKEMTASVLSQTFNVLKTSGNFNNLIGLPLTLFGLNDSHEWAVLEVAMNRPGEIRRLTEIANPDLGVITNVEAGHLEGVKDIDGVMEAKGELLEGLGQDGTAVLNIDDQRVCRLAERFSGRVVSFGIESSAEVSGTPVSQTRSGVSFDLSWYDESIRVSLKIPGKAAIYNALAAAAVGYRADLSIEQVKKGLESAVPLPGRMEISTLPGGIHLIDDTYNANPGSVAAAIETLCSLKGSGRGIFVIGDMLELGQHAQAAHKHIGILAERAGLAGLYVTGEFAGAVTEGAVGAGMDHRKISIGTREEIVEVLKERLGPGDWVLIKGSRLTAMDKVVQGLMIDD